MTAAIALPREGFNEATSEDISDIVGDTISRTTNITLHCQWKRKIQQAVAELKYNLEEKKPVHTMTWSLLGLTSKLYDMKDFLTEIDPNFECSELGLRSLRSALPWEAKDRLQASHHNLLLVIYHIHKVSPLQNQILRLPSLQSHPVRLQQLVSL